MNAIAYVVLKNVGLIKQFAQSARSLRTQHYDEPIFVVTDLPDESWPADTGHQIVPITGTNINLEVSRLPRYLDKFDVDQVLKLDTDTLAVAPIDEIWNIEGDVSFRRGGYPTLWEKAMVYTPAGNDYPPNFKDFALTMEEVDHSKPFYHGGVYKWKRSYRAALLFEQWEREMLRVDDAIDEWSLVRAANVTNVWPTDLPWKFNALPPTRFSVEQCKAHGDVILHFYGAENKLRMLNLDRG
jgi:hypothetical protein